MKTVEHFWRDRDTNKLVGHQRNMCWEKRDVCVVFRVNLKKGERSMCPLSIFLEDDCRTCKANVLREVLKDEPDIYDCKARLSSRRAHAFAEGMFLRRQGKTLDSMHARAKSYAMFYVAGAPATLFSANTTIRDTFKSSGGTTKPSTGDISRTVIPAGRTNWQETPEKGGERG